METRDMNNAITGRHAFWLQSLSHPGRSATLEMTVKGSRDRNICGTLDTTGIGHLGTTGTAVQPGTELFMTRSVLNSTIPQSGFNMNGWVLPSLAIPSRRLREQPHG